MLLCKKFSRGIELTTYFFQLHLSNVHGEMSFENVSRNSDRSHRGRLRHRPFGGKMRLHETRYSRSLQICEGPVHLRERHCPDARHQARRAEEDARNRLEKDSDSLQAKPLTSFQRSNYFVVIGRISLYCQTLDILDKKKKRIRYC